MPSDEKGRYLLESALEEVKRLDARIFPFDSDKVQEVEAAVVDAVRDLFGEDSPEFEEFEDFHISSGPVSLGDSRTEKQARFEIGLPQAVTRLETLLDQMEQAPDSGKSFFAESSGPFGGKKEKRAAKAGPQGDPQKLPAPTGPKAKTAPPVPPKPEGKDKTPPVKQPGSAARANQPGRVLILQAGGDEITFAATALMDKIGVDVLLLEEDTPEKVDEAFSQGELVFTLVCVSSFVKGGFSGLTAVISKPRPKHEMAFKIGLLVGKLGPGKVAILYTGEKPQDVPESLFGVYYIPFKEEGGWQIGFLKLLKSSGFYIDANLLFD